MKTKNNKPRNSTETKVEQIRREIIELKAELMRIFNADHGPLSSSRTDRTMRF